MAGVDMSGIMDGCIRVDGKMGKCMEKGYISGKINGDIKGSMLMIKNMVKGDIFGRMGRCSRGYGFKGRGKVRE